MIGRWPTMFFKKKIGILLDMKPLHKRMNHDVASINE